MTTTSVDDAVILPQSQGTGLSGEDAVIDASINGVLNRYVGGEYVSTEYSTGLAFQNHDGTNDTVEVGPGIVFVQDNSTSTSGERGSGGNPQAESSTTSGYDTELPEGHTYAVLLPTATEISVSDSTLNEVYVDIDDVTANNSVNLEHDGSITASPGNTSLKIGETNPDDATADTRANDDASPTFDSLTVNGTTTTDALNANSLIVGGTLYEEAENSPIDVSSTTSETFNLTSSTDEVIIVPESNYKSTFDKLQVNGVSTSDYDSTDTADATTTNDGFLLPYRLSSCRYVSVRGINNFNIGYYAEYTNSGSNINYRGVTSATVAPISQFTLIESGGTTTQLKARVYRREMDV